MWRSLILGSAGDRRDGAYGRWDRRREAISSNQEVVDLIISRWGVHLGLQPEVGMPPSLKHPRQPIHQSMSQSGLFLDGGIGGPQRPKCQAFNDGKLVESWFRSMQSPSPAVVGCPWDERDGRVLATPVLCAAIGKLMKPSSPIMAWFLPCQKVVCTPAARPPTAATTLSVYRDRRTRLPDCSTCALADPNADRCAYLSSATG